MRKGLGVICLLLGVVCLIGAVVLVGYNRWESEHAATATDAILDEVRTVIEENNVKPNSIPSQMSTVDVDGDACIGILSIPVLDVELPVLTDWSYAKLKKAPCLYFGTYYENNFVIAAHNYPAHFGRLSELQTGDLVVFTDVNGTEYAYEVVLLETLPKDATQEMITSGFDLSLYTCTPGGASRVTVRCRCVQ